MPAVAYPSELPSAGLAGAGGGPNTTTISDEKELGEPEIRQRQGLVNQVVNVELPPLSQTEYEAFLSFFENDLYGGILPFTFNDPITKGDHTYKFVKATPSFTEERVNYYWIRVTFQLIRLKYVPEE